MKWDTFSPLECKSQDKLTAVALYTDARTFTTLTSKCVGGKQNQYAYVCLTVFIVIPAALIKPTIL